MSGENESKRTDIVISAKFGRLHFHFEATLPLNRELVPLRSICLVNQVSLYQKKGPWRTQYSDTQIPNLGNFDRGIKMTSFKVDIDMQDAGHADHQFLSAFCPLIGSRALHAHACHFPNRHISPQQVQVRMQESKWQG